MKKNKKTENIILRTSPSDHSLLKIKSSFFNMSKSQFLVYCALSYWNDEDITTFKEMLKLYQEGGEIEKKQIVELLFQHYRLTGFPHVSLTDEQKVNRMERIMKSKNVLLEDDYLQINLQGIDLANSYHPHMMRAYYSRGENSPYQTFHNDEKLRDCINRWMELGYIPNPAGMRRILKTRDGTRGVVNFKPVIAKFIYDAYLPYGGRTLDPCSGYGGRLAGCIASNKDIFYHGIDPHGETVIGNTQMAGFFAKHYDILNERIYKFRFRIDMGECEEIMPSLKEKDYDLIFTSSPYYDTEIYSEQINQSCHKYVVYEEWLNKFLFKIVDESFRLLKDNGRMILNIKNLEKYKIADDLCEYCEKNWELEKIYKMRLSNSEYRRKDGKTWHTEPIFVWRKKGN